ncbi:MalY/PatB family protein [Actinokineospora enzanensis]|uniref:MalY/PatB family protein n=1 Tax=Actinokineospora enzanensis TaxID=155975 RepID=UPI0003645CE2|nr:aminotransferase class I/II-fold pyridoxal phosphate-dependent enzyme [Actinokineospora enzanensis]
MTVHDPELATPTHRDGEKWAKAADGVLPAWVADMDFPVAPAIRRALIERIDTDLGYPAWFNEPDGAPLGEVYAARMHRRHGFPVEPTHVRLFTDVNQAIWVLLHLATEAGDAVAVHTPACPPLLDVLHAADRPARHVPMVSGRDGWGFDLERLDRDLTRGDPARCRLVILVNPHNPTGRVFSRTELEGLAELVLRHDLLVLSDEVHADLAYAPHRHLPFAALGAEIRRRTMTVTSASKAFNLAGVRCAVAHIGVPEVRAALDAQRGLPYGQVGVLAVEAVRAAWTSGDAWLDGVRATLAVNRRILLEGLPAEIGHHPPEATFLSWLDCRGLGVGADPAGFFEREAKVMLFSGPAFGPGGDGFVRLNFATDRGVLTEILHRIRGAVDRL